jgi:hypothetical protein
MSAALAITFRAVRDDLARWLTITLGFALAYNLALLTATIIRFGSWPNYVRVHDLADAVRLIFKGTPDLADALTLLGDEIWVEIGYMHPSFRLAEWSFNLMPARMALVLLGGALIATYVALGHACAIRSRSGVAAVGAGTALVALTSATLMWVVCCSSPSWVVGLAMLGLGVSMSLALEPLGLPLSAAGFLLLIAGILAKAYRVATPQKSEVPVLATAETIGTAS